MVSVFVDIFIFVSNVYIHAAAFGPGTSYKTTLDISLTSANNASSYYDWPIIKVLGQLF